MDTVVQVQTILLLLLVPLPVTWTGKLTGRPVQPSVEDIPIKSQNEACPDIPPRLQREVLGSLFNPKYMSFDLPKDSYMAMDIPDEIPVLNLSEHKPEFSRSNSQGSRYGFYQKTGTLITIKDKPEKGGSFSADDLEPPVEWNSPAVDERESSHTHRQKRHALDPVINALISTGDVNFKWHCDAPQNWTFLGDDYVPKFLRSVDCNSSKCQGPRFRCEPLSFSIVVLRKRKNKCPPKFEVRGNTIKIREEAAIDLRKYFIIETRVVRFCCVCKLTGDF